MPRSRRTRRRYPRLALVVAVVLGAGALAWLLIGVPTFVKYPTDLTAEPRYEGTFTVFVDPATAAPLDEPLELPFSIDRRIDAIGSESGASRVVVRETLRQRAGDLLDTEQTNVYVMDRRTIRNVRDDRAYAFETSNVVDRSPAYRLNLPFDTSRDETYEIYRNEIAGTYTIRADEENPTTEREGLRLSNFVAQLDERPLAPAYLAELNEVVSLPESLTADQLAPYLERAGLDLDATIAALAPVLTPSETATVTELIDDPVPIEYVLSFDGTAAVEPVTGAEVAVANTERVGAHPIVEELGAIQQVLRQHADVPEARTADRALDQLVNGPAIPLFEYSYDQTPASVADIADKASSLRRQVLFAKVWLPVGLAGAAVLSLIIGTLIFVRRRRVPADADRSTPRPSGRTRDDRVPDERSGRRGPGDAVRRGRR